MRASLLVVAATFVACATSRKPVATPAAGASPPATARNGLAELAPAEASALGDFDHDGIPDGTDLCPREAEDADGFEDQDGCPDPDNDKDRIPDARDKCPDAAEVYNGVDDEDGCPDAGRVLKIGPCKLVILDKILFTKNAATVPAEATSLLDELARTMELNPQILSVEVQGHASRDERGPDRLARARASAVLEYLVERRVARQRLVLKAFPAEHPVSPGKSESPLVLSRRVEFFIRDRKLE
jgi:outer membrane protein OmpA-like peptidoglycan-associated protein